MDLLNIYCKSLVEVGNKELMKGREYKLLTMYNHLIYPMTRFVSSMKSYIAVVLLLICFQIVSAQNFSIGIKFSPQITWSGTDNKNTSSNGNRINLSYGLMADYYFTENYAIGTEICLNSYGTNLNLKTDKFDEIQYVGNKVQKNIEVLNYDYRINYLQVPFLLKMRTNEIGHTRYFAEFGFGAGIRTQAKADIKSGAFELNNVNVNDPDDEDIYKITPTAYDDDVALFRGAIIMGAGIQYNFFGSSQLQAGIRYDNGLTSFTSDDRWTTTLNYISLNFGILF